MCDAEAEQLSDAFWKNELVRRLDTSLSTNPCFRIFLAAQVVNHAKGFLSKEIDVQSLIEQKGDIHHLFPKNYLRKNGVDSRADYNHVANYVYTQSEINIKIKDAAPFEYMGKVQNQTKGGDMFAGGIVSPEELAENLKENCIPIGFCEMNVDNYNDFIKNRLNLMAEYIRQYYDKLK